MGKRRKRALRVRFDSKLKLEFHGTKITSDKGFQYTIRAPTNDV